MKYAKDAFNVTVFTDPYGWNLVLFMSGIDGYIAKTPATGSSPWTLRTRRGELFTFWLYGDQARLGVPGEAEPRQALAVVPASGRRTWQFGPAPTEATMVELLCLANSRKLGGTCVAGRRIHGRRPAEWLRPVGNRSGGALYSNHIRLPEGITIHVGDVVRVPVQEPCPHGCHTEDWLVDTRHPWQRVRHATWEEIVNCVETPGTLWYNGQSPLLRPNSEIPEEAAAALTNSLYFIRVEAVELLVEHVKRTPEDSQRPRLTAYFSHAGVGYGLSVTDLVTEQGFASRASGRYPLGEALLTISLSEPFPKQNGDVCRYKLVAAIVTAEDQHYE